MDRSGKQVGKNPDRIRHALSGVRGEVSFQEPMSRHTSIRVGGPADALVVPVDLEDLKQVVTGANQYNMAVFPFGGSNLIVTERGIRGIVVKLSRLQEVTQHSESLQAQAGIPMPRLAQGAATKGLSGLEFSCGIPATLGGAIVMNAGTHEGEMASILESVRIMDRQGEVMEWPRDRLSFGYRHSRLPEGIIVEGVLRLKKATHQQIQERMQHSLNHRRRTQPLHLPNAGCIFKNPDGQSAGALIEELQLKGARIGDAEISETHGNFIVNHGRATATEILALIRDVQHQVKQARGIQMGIEVRIVGEDAESF